MRNFGLLRFAKPSFKDSAKGVENTRCLMLDAVAEGDLSCDSRLATCDCTADALHKR